MREAIPAIAGASIVALFAGAALTYFLFAAPQEPSTQPIGPVSELPENASSETSLPKPDSEHNTAEKENFEKLLNEANVRADDLEKERNTLKAERDALAGEKTALEEKVRALESKVAELSKPEEGANRLLIDFGKWAEVQEVREADWSDLGDAYAKMTPLLKAYAEAAAQGKPLDADTAKELRTQNERLVQHYLKVRGKLPTNGRANGEFTHPINLVNFLAAQLESLNLPLSDAQKKQLKELGEEYDRRWDKLEAAYNENTWELQKLIDECDLKQWFYEEMFKVTTSEQRNAAVPPELQGMIGLDLYSPGLILQVYLDPLRAADIPALKVALKDSVSKALAIELTTLDTADYIFEEWLAGLQLQPVTQLEAGRWRTAPVLAAAKAEFAALAALERDVIVDEEVRKRVREVQTIVVPQLVKQE